MKPLPLIAKQAYLAILGNLSGAVPGGTPAYNSVNAVAAVQAPSTSPHLDSPSFTSKTGKVLVMAQVTFDKNGGTLANADPVVVQLYRDFGGGGQTALTGVDNIVQAFTNASTVSAPGTLVWIDTVTPGVAHTWSMVGVPASGHTAGLLSNQGSIQVSDI